MLTTILRGVEDCSGTLGICVIDDDKTEPVAWWRRGRRILWVAGAAVAVAGLAGAGYLRHDAPAVAATGAAPSQPASAPEQRLRRIDLGVRLPAGWREASEAELRQLAVPPGSTVLFRGAALAEPDRGMFVRAATPHGVDLVATARAAERGVIRQLGIDARAYHAAGCAVVELGGGRVARCRGLAERGAADVAVEIFVRAVGARDVVALSLAGPSQAAAGDTTAIVASFTP